MAENNLVKVKDYLPKGDKITNWNGIAVGGNDFLKSLIGGFLGNDVAELLIGKSSAAQGNKSAALHDSDFYKSNGLIVNGITGPANLSNILTPTQQRLLNNPATNAKLELNNNNYIKNNLPFVGGLTSSSLQGAKSIYAGGWRFTGEDAVNFEKLGLTSNSIWRCNIPTANKIELTWGQALTKTISDPVVIGNALSIIGDLSPKISEYKEQFRNVILDYGATIDATKHENDASLDGETLGYVQAMRYAMNKLNLENNEMLGLYKYYRMSMDYHNSPIMNPDGTGFNLGHEVADSVFGSINYNTTRFLDGAGDYIAETWQNVSYTGAAYVRDTFDEFTQFSETLEETTGISLSIDPKFKEGIYDQMEKWGFGNPGIGTDTEAFLTGTLIQKIYARISSGGGSVNIINENILYYFERYEYRTKLTSERRIKVKLTEEQLAALDLNSPDLTITIERNYGFATGQDPTGNLPLDYMIKYQTVEKDCIVDWPAKIVNNKTSEDNKEKAKNNKTKQTNSTSEPPDHGKEYTLQEIELIITPPNLTGSGKSEMFNGIPSGENTISELLQLAFETSYETGVSCIARPKNDFTLKDVAIPPTNFEGLLAQFQKEYDIYEGGPTVYHDRLPVNGTPEDVYFIMPKRGVVDMQFDEGWTVELRVKEMSSPDVKDIEMICYLIPSRKKIIWPITEADIKVPGEASAWTEKSVVRYSQGSVLGAIGQQKNSWLNREVITTNNEYISPVKPPVKEKTHDTLYIKIPNAFFTFTPGDMVNVKWRGKTYKANVKEWAAQNYMSRRQILLVLISEEEIDKPKKWYDHFTPGTWIENMQQTIAATNAKITNTLDGWSEKTGDWLQEKFQDFAKWEDEHLQFRGHNILEWLNMIDPEIDMPNYDYMKSYEGTEIQKLQDLYGTQWDGNPFTSGVLPKNNADTYVPAITNTNRSGSWANTVSNPKAALPGFNNNILSK